MEGKKGLGRGAEKNANGWEGMGVNRKEGEERRDRRKGERRGFSNV